MVTIDLSNAGFWVQFGVYFAAVIAGVVYYFKKRKAGEIAPPQLMKMFTDQTTMLMQWFWKAIADGVISPEEAEELKVKFKANFDDTINMIIKLYTPTLPIPEELIPEVITDPVVPEPVIEEVIVDEIAIEEPPEEPVIGEAEPPKVE